MMTEDHEVYRANIKTIRKVKRSGHRLKSNEKNESNAQTQIIIPIENRNEFSSNHQDNESPKYVTKKYKQIKKEKVLSSSEQLFSDIYEYKPKIQFDDFAKIYHRKERSENRSINNSLFYSLSRNVSLKKMTINNNEDEIPQFNLGKILELNYNEKPESLKKTKFNKKVNVGNFKSMHLKNPSSPRNSIIFENIQKNNKELKEKILSIEFSLNKNFAEEQIKQNENGKFLTNRNLYLKKIYSKMGMV